MPTNTIVVLLFVIAIVLVAVIIMLAVSRMQQKAMRKSYKLIVANQGNARSRYELSALDPAHVLSFEFTMSGVPLGQPPAWSKSSPPNQHPTAASSKPANQSSARVAASKASSTVADTGQKASGLANLVGEVLDSLSDILPGSAGDSLQRASENLRRGQANVQRVERQGQRAQAVSQDFQGYASQAQTMKGSGSSSGPGSVSTTDEGTDAMTTPDASVAPATSSSQPQTPFVEPGNQIELALLMRLVLRPQEDHVPFSVSSLSLEEPNAQPVMQSATAIFNGVTGLSYYLPYLIIGGAAILLVVLLLIATHTIG